MELNNIRKSNVVPGECVQYIGKYTTSTQYPVDLAGDGKDNWISSVPYFKDHIFGVNLRTDVCCSACSLNVASSD